MNIFADPTEQRGLLDLMERLRGSGDWLGARLATLIERGLRILGKVGANGEGWAEVDRFVRSGECDGLAGFASDRSPPIPAPGLSQASEHEGARRLIGALVAQIDLVWEHGSQKKEGDARDWVVKDIKIN